MKAIRLICIILLFNILIPEIVSSLDTGEEGCKPQIIIDDQDQDILHCAYYKHWGVKGVYYKKSIDKGMSWSSPVTISTMASSKKSSLAVRGNKIAIVYVVDFGDASGKKDIRIRISDNGGNSFSSNDILDNHLVSQEKWQDFPDVAIDSKGFIHVIWSCRNTVNNYWHVIYRNKNVTWSSPEIVEDYSMVIKHPSICVDSSDNVHVTYDKRDWRWWLGLDRQYIQYRKRTSTGTWGSLESVWDQAGAPSDWDSLMSPEIVISDDYLHITWQTGRTNPDSMNSMSRILYSRKTNDSTAIWSSAITVGTGFVPSIDAYQNEVFIVWHEANNLKQVKYSLTTNKGMSFRNSSIIASNTSSPYFNIDFDPYYGIPFISTFHSNWVISWRDDNVPNYVNFRFRKGPQGPLLNVSSSTVGFGLITAKIDDQRKQATNYITVTYANLEDPWYIKIYSDDGDDGQELSGLKGQSDPNVLVPIKCWCVNYGPVTNTNSLFGPDEENAYFWAGYDFNKDSDKNDVFTNGTFMESLTPGVDRYPFDLDGDGFMEGDQFDFSKGDLSEEPKWLTIPEKNSSFERKLTGTGSELGGEFNTHFGLDINGVQAQGYKGELIIEVVLE
ncbi:MAG: exo-alpha-sialidase [Spirochaetes bacterium]|nr:exo-alpha-sialidase [Spirochaetota bacterium]